MSIFLHITHAQLANYKEVLTIIRSIKEVQGCREEELPHCFIIPYFVGSRTAKPHTTYYGCSVSLTISPGITGV